MATADELRALADRVEAGEPDETYRSCGLTIRRKGSRKQDAEIAVAVGHARVVQRFVCANRDDSDDEIMVEDEDGEIGAPPNYTGSVDAALTLVPEGWMLTHLSELGGDGMPYAHLGNPERAMAPAGLARTMPRALTAAALRALAEQAP